MRASLIDTVEITGVILEAAGVVVIVLGAAVSTVTFLVHLRSWDRLKAYTTYRANFARSVLLGLEFLVAGDIVRTIVIEPTFTSIGVLALLVLVRSFLSITLEMEVSGHWPWRRDEGQQERKV